MAIRFVGRRSLGSGVVLALCVLASMVVASAGSARAAEPTVAERYARAAKLRWPTTANAMRNTLVTPHWVGTTNYFWYRRETPTGAEFVTVDAATGARRPAFDAGAVAASLASLTKTAVSADALPFATFDAEPDGAIAFTAKGDRFRCAASGACEKLGRAPTPDLVVSPDKRTAVSMRDGNLWLRDLATGADRALTTDGTAQNGWGVVAPPGDLRMLARERAGGGARAPFWTFWSPDSRRLITAHVDLTGVAAYPYLDYAPPDGSFRPKVLSLPLSLTGEPLAKFDLYAIDIATGRRTRLNIPGGRIETMELSPKSLAWSVDAAHAYLAVMSADMDSARLLDLDLDSGNVREVIKEAGGYPALVSAGFYDAAEVAVLPKTSEAIWFSQRDGWGHLYLYDLKTGRLKTQITKGPWVSRAIIKVDEAKRQLYLVGVGREPGNPYHRSLYRVGLDGKGLTLLTPEPADKPMINPDAGHGFDGTPAFQPVSPNGCYVAYTVAPLASASTAVIRRTDGTGAPITFETADVEALIASGFRPPEPFTAKAADGRSDIHGVIYRPSDYDPAKRYPVLDAQYNSPITTIVPQTLAQSATNVIEAAPPAADAELGLIVVMMDARGTPFRGAAFSTPAPGYLADMGLTDHVAVIRALAARDPSMDLERVGITGASFGGWTAIRALITHNDIYKVAVAWAPPGAFYSMYDAAGLTAANGLATYADGSQIRSKPNDKPVSWTAMDSIAQIDRLKGKLLIGSGGVDENVLPGSTLQFMDAAAKANKNVEQMFLPGTNHGPVVYFDYVTRRVWDFLTLNLRGEIPPTEVAFPPIKMPGGPG